MKRRVVMRAAAVALLAATAASAQGGDQYDRAFEQYLTQARALSTGSNATPWIAGLFADLRARAVNDLVTVRVVERIAASGTADSSLDKTSSVGISTGRVFGINPKFADWFDPTELARLSAASDFQGGGATTRNGALSAVITARVAEVLPNGDMVLEGIREVDINGDKQMVVLTGVVRPADIGPGNVVPSTAVGQMRIRYFGNGLIKDNLSPGFLVRLFNKVF
jgi:flagellar L-ring protein precursor FlgH